MRNSTFEVSRQERENNQGVIRRFTRRLRESGILNAAKKSRYKERPKSAQLLKKKALRRIEKRAEFEQAKKMSRPS